MASMAAIAIRRPNPAALILGGCIAAGILITCATTDCAPPGGRVKPFPPPPPPPGDPDGEGTCSLLLGKCLENPWQHGMFGPRADCGACYRECKHAKGAWPFYKCPIF